MHHVVDVRYTFVVDGTRYAAERVSFGQRAKYATKRSAQNEADRLLKNPSAEVFYDPDNPMEATLHRGSTTDSESGPYLALLLIVVGVFIAMDKLALRWRFVAAGLTAVASGIVLAVYFT